MIATCKNRFYNKIKLGFITDFLITTEQGIVVRSVKPAKALDNSRVCEKLEIERQYWKKQGIEWRLVTENEISRVKARNIEWLFSGNPLAYEKCRRIISVL